MSSFREKSQVFIIGLAIGLLAAGAFFILKLDDYFKELSFYKNLSSLSQPAPSNELKASTEEEKNEKPAKSKSQKSIKVNTDNAVSSQDQVLDADTLRTASKADSINASFVAGSDIVVRKDELLSTKTLEVYNLSPTVKNSSKDSLLQKVSGIKDDRSGEMQMFNIEFWSSPLNYRGYRMSKYKIILYGIPSADGLKVYKLDDVVYLKHQSNVYRLDYASDFHPYDRITDESITGKFK